MTDNSFSIQRGYQRLLKARKCTHTQDEIITDLKAELMGIKEEALLTYAMQLIVELDFRDTSELYSQLQSPMKQALYLIDVYYSIGYNIGKEKLTKAKIDKISHLLDEMEMAYFASIAFPNNGDIFHDDRDEKLDVALSTFLNCFSNARLCYEEQTLDRIIRYFKPYDTWINSKYGFCVDDAIKFILHIRHLNNSKFTEIIRKGSKYAFYAHHPEEWKKLTDKFVNRGLEPNEWASQPELKGLTDFIRTNLGEICIHTREEVEEVDLANDVKQKLLDFFLYDKIEAEKKGTIYYADSHLSESKPLFCVDNQIVCPINKFLLEALYNRLSADLQRNVSKYKQKVDYAFEEKVRDVFHSFFPQATKIFTNYSVDGVSENDLLIGCGEIWLVVEIKNSGFRPPMRDPIKAFDKIQTDFNKSVQLGYDQCKRVEDILVSGSNVEVRSTDTKKLLYKVNSKNISAVWPIVVTDFKYGPIQIDLSKLLKKEEDYIFPWSVCLDDLESFLLAMKKSFRGIAPTRFVEFLDYRERFHGHVGCFDELELCGWYLCNREQFKHCAAVDTMVFTNPCMSEIFDAYYKVCLGFSNELDTDVKQQNDMPAYTKDFLIEEVTNENFR